MIKDKLQRQKGATILEALIYIFILTLTLFIVTSSLYSLARSYRSLKSSASLENAAQIALEKMTRVSRDAVNIDIALSTLGSSPGVLTLNTRDQNGLPTTTRIFLSNGQIHIEESGSDPGPLTSQSVRVTNLVFRRVATSRSEAVKIEITFESGQGTEVKSKPFYSTVVLRGSYPSE